MTLSSMLFRTLILAAGFAVLPGEAAPVVPWGAQAARALAQPTIPDMIRLAIEDEYLARAEYQAIMAAFGQVRPFSNILRTEERHIDWVKESLASRGLPVPEDRAAAYVHVPSTLKAALEAGIQAEIDNIAMYDRFLAMDILAQPDQAALKDLFTRLRNASKNHLSAFQRNLSRP